MSRASVVLKLAFAISFAALLRAAPALAQTPPRTSPPKPAGWSETQLDSILTSNSNVFNAPKLQWGAGKFTIVWPERLPDNRVNRLKYIETAPTLPGIPAFTAVPDDRAAFSAWLPLKLNGASWMVSRRSGPSYIGYHLQPMTTQPPALTPIFPTRDLNDYGAAVSGPASVWFAACEPKSLSDPSYFLTLYELVPGRILQTIPGPDAVSAALGVLGGVPYVGYLRLENTSDELRYAQQFELSRIDGNGLKPLYTSRRDPSRFDDSSTASQVLARPRLAIDPSLGHVWALYYDSVEEGLMLVRWDGKSAEDHIIVRSESVVIADVVAWNGAPYVYYQDRSSNRIVQLHFAPTEVFSETARQYNAYRDLPGANLEAEVSDSGQVVVVTDLIDPGGTFVRLVALSRELGAAAPPQPQ